MNAFYEHHKDSIRFGYRCFDRLLLNGLIQPFQQPERVIGFFNSYRRQYPVRPGRTARCCHAVSELGHEPLARSGARRFWRHPKTAATNSSIHTSRTRSRTRWLPL